MGSLFTVAGSGLVIVVSLAVYLLPVVIGRIRHVPDLGAVAVINILLGWTVIGWVAALALAFRSVNPAGPTVQLVQNLPPAAPPGDWPDADWAGPPGPPPARPADPPPLTLPHPGDPGDNREQ